MTITASHGLEYPAVIRQAPVPEDIEAAKALILAEGARLCAAAVNHKAGAIVLTGSMSRGEATLKRDGACWRVLGDATFLVVTDGPVQLRVGELQQEIERSLSSYGIRCKIAVVTSSTAGLRRLKPHIYAYELRDRGVVLWGDKHALSLISRFTVAEIPKEDGWWLLCNRMIELLESAANAEDSNDNDAAVRYRITKLYLAMAACYLLAIEQYDPSYRDRAARLQKLAASQNPPPSPVALQRFSNFVSRCTDLKLQGELGGTSDAFPQWHDAVSDAEALWRWALGRISGMNPRLSLADLLAAVAVQQPIFARAKGWVRSAYVHPSAFRRNWFRWARLAVSTSPRYLVYGAAGELFFAAPGPDAITSAKLAWVVAKLPLPHAEGDQKLTWRTAAKLVAHNFHLFLESTRS